MDSAPQKVIDHHLNLVGQNVLTIASWVITVGVLVLAYRMGRKEKTQFYVVMVLSAMLAALAEPLYDVMFSLYFYSDHGFQKSFTAFGIPQPVWAYSGYAILYALPAMFLVRKAWTGTLTAKVLWLFAGIELLESCVFEMAGINMGTYTYWGPHVFRIFSYPIIIGVLESAQVMTFAIAAANLRHRMTAPWQSIALFGIFPVTMLGANFGAGFAEILAIHTQGASVWLVRVCTVVSIGLAVGLVRLDVAMIPRRGSQHEVAPAGVVADERVPVTA